MELPRRPPDSFMRADPAGIEALRRASTLPGELVDLIGDFAKTRISKLNEHLMDLEQFAIESPRFYSGKWPVGPKRYTNPMWANHIQSILVDATWADYVHYCESGQGQEWFYEPDERDFLCPVLSASDLEGEV